MKIAMIIVRTLVGLLFIMASVVVLFGFVAPPPMPDGPLKSFNEGLAASGGAGEWRGARARPARADPSLGNKSVLPGFTE